MARMASMARMTSRLSVAGNNAQQTMQRIHCWRQAGLVQRASTRQCGSEEMAPARKEEAERRARSIRSPLSALSFLLCAAMLPSVLCTYSASSDIIASKFRHSIPDNFVSGASKLKKSVSFSCKMDQAILPGSHKPTSALQDAEYGFNVYTPVHSSSDLESAAGERVQSMRLRGQDGALASSAARRRSPSSSDVTSAAPYVYTRLQTQLFPQMRF